MIFALFMILLGEAIGMYKLTRRSLFASVFYLLLMVTSLVQLSGWELSGLMILNSIPIVIFVVLFVTFFMRQNEAREQAQLLAVELEAANRQLSDYAARVEDLTIANERQRMARQLHDTLSQGLAGLILQLEAADAHHANNHIDEAQTVVSNAMGQARSTLADARRAIDDLRQPSLDDLDSALRLEISEFTEATGITCSFTSDPIPPLPDLVKDSLTRSLAEALTNIEKHAKAKKLAVNVVMKDNKLLFTIQDDGQGFDASFIPSGHYGILGIKERVRLVNGSFEIQSEKGNGTLMKIQVPL
jgi:NarL family two-component system sensor histidine kinase YdfH